MTDRIIFLTVALRHDIRIDDIESLVNAILMLKGVLTVNPEVADTQAWLGELRAREFIRDQNA